VTSDEASTAGDDRMSHVSHPDCSGEGGESKAVNGPVSAHSRTMHPGEPLLLISHTFPPYKGIGGRRWAKFAKALARMGHPVHVIHSAGGEELKGSLWTADISEPGIMVHPLPQHFPTVLFKRPLTRIADKVMYRVWKTALPLITKGNPLDKSILWRGQLLREAGALIKQHGIRWVLITGAPFRLFHFGVELKRAHGIKLFCDLRDPWTWHDGYGQGSLSTSEQAYERMLEREMMENADRVTSPHPSVIDHLRKNYPEQEAKCSVLGHAIDPDELGLPLPPRNDGEVRLIYAGSLYGAHEAEAYFEQLMRAFEKVRDQRPDRWSRVKLDLYITGHGTEAYREKLKARTLDDHIRMHAPIPAHEVFKRIAGSDGVLVFIPSFNKDLLGTKFTEIFWLRRPVIHVGAPGAVGKAILSRKLGVSFPVDRLVEELPSILTGERTIAIDTNVDLSEHLLGPITSRLAEDLLD
jgi:glycosyltransferase involved in cell wall biosynthesis